MTYLGEKLSKKKKVGSKEIDAYIPDPDLVRAVNMAILLQKPLLLMGEPGCGKTRLAEAVAYELYGKDYEEYFIRWDIKSTTQAKDGFYQYNALNRIQEAQLVRPDDTELKDKVAKYEPYIEYKLIGKGFKRYADKENRLAPDKRLVILIDEIDKADIDFPNDLLQEIEKNEFYIPETEEVIKAPIAPILFITSNNEKELPPAFLRRCIFHYIKFPAKHQLINIVNAHFKPRNNTKVKNAVDYFMQVRKIIEEKLPGVGKKSSTSELLDWFQLLELYKSDEATLKEMWGDNVTDAIKALKKRDFDAMSAIEGGVPFKQVLLKNWEAHIKLFEQDSAES